MSDTPTVTEREAAARERAAFVAGAYWNDGLSRMSDLTAVAAIRYPTIKERRWREYRTPSGTYRYNPILCRFEFTMPVLFARGWVPVEFVPVGAVDLKAEPYEEVEQ